MQWMALQELEEVMAARPASPPEFREEDCRMAQRPGEQLPEVVPITTLQEAAPPPPVAIVATGMGAIGRLTIPAIKLEMPLYEGTSERALQIGAGLFENGAEIGTQGNVVVTAHRSRTSGHQFNRLEELKSGDEVFVHLADGRKYLYRVTSSVIALPSETELVASSPEMNLLTLYTCHPITADTHRLIVQALPIQP